TRIEIDVNSNADATLLLYDAWYPGWKAMIDGTPTDLYRANVMFRGVQIPAGQHRVIFYFEPDLWRTALLIGAAAWGIFLVLVVWVWRKTNQHASGT
ncbi:MAG: YfhO family protein, partial [Aggregatilineales bacterium]